MREADALVERARRFLRSAEVLIREGDYESSVSRAYYGMFFAVQAVLLTEGLSFSSHAGALSAFGERFVKPGTFPREASADLYRAFEKRHMGDYEHTFCISRREAEEVLESGKRFVERVVSFLERKG